MAGSSDELDREGVDPERLVAETRAHDAGNRAGRSRCSTRFATRVAQIDGPPHDRAVAPPVIGICAVRERARWAFWDQAAHLVADSYVAPVQRAGGVAVLLPVDARRRSSCSTGSTV